jgi:hypothetical protein
LPPTSQTTKLKIKTKPRAPFLCQILPTTGGKKNNNENCVRLLLCCRLFLWCHRIIILLDGYQHSIVTTHTHTHTRTGSARDMHLLRDVEAKDSQQRDTHTHTHCTSEKDTQQQSGQ